MGERRNPWSEKSAFFGGSILRVDIASQLMGGDECSPTVLLSCDETHSDALIQCRAAQSQNACDFRYIAAQLRKRIVENVTPPNY